MRNAGGVFLRGVDRRHAALFGIIDRKRCQLQTRDGGEMGSFMSCCEGDGQHPLEVFVIDSKKKEKKKKEEEVWRSFCAPAEGAQHTVCLNPEGGLM